MSSIVVTTDLSDAAQRALPTASQLAEKLGLPLVLLHVVHAPLLAPALTDSVDLNREDAERELRQLAGGLGDNVGIVVGEADDVVAGIVREAEAAGAEFLVVASHGRTGLERLRLGSVAEKLLDTAGVPVVCVPAQADRAGGTSRVVVTTDRSDTATHAFPVARRLAAAMALPMTLLVVEDPLLQNAPSSLDDQAAQLAGGEEVEVTTQVVTSADAAQGIIAHAQLENAAFICTAASPKSPLRRMVFGSVSRDVMRMGSSPVVIVPPPSS